MVELVVLYGLCSGALTVAVLYDITSSTTVYRLLHDLMMAWAWPVVIAVRRPWRWNGQSRNRSSKP